MKKRILVISIIITGLIVLMLLTGEAALGCLGMVLVIAILVSFLLNLYASKHISAVLKVNEKETSFGTIEIEVLLKNDGFMPVFKGGIKIQTENRNFKLFNHNEMNFSLMGKQQKTLKYEIQSDFCGEYEIKICYVRCYDLWGFTYRDIDRNVIRTACMFPESHLISKVIQVMKTSYEKEKIFAGRKNINLSDILQYRDFTDGDSFKNINWKLSNKFDSLLVREFDTPIDNLVLLVMDINEGNQIYQNLCYTVAYSISMTYAAKKLPHQVYIPGSRNAKPEVVENKKDLLKAMRKVLSAPINHGEEAALVLAKTNYPWKYAKIIYVTNSLSKKAYRTIKQWDNSVLVLVNENTFKRDIAEDALKKLAV